MRRLKDRADSKAFEAEVEAVLADMNQPAPPPGCRIVRSVAPDSSSDTRLDRLEADIQRLKDPNDAHYAVMEAPRITPGWVAEIGRRQEAERQARRRVAAEEFVRARRQAIKDAPKQAIRDQQLAELDARLDALRATIADTEADWRDLWTERGNLVNRPL